MSNDNKTLADVQPGGRVRLGGQAALKRLHAHLTAYPPPCNPEDVAVLGAALSAQPSPGGQGDALAMIQRYDDACIAFTLSVTDDRCDDTKRRELRRAVAAARNEVVFALAARQPVGEPVDDYDSAFQEANRPPYLVDAAGIYALQSFLTVAEEFRRSAEPYIEAINEGACGGEDEVSEAFDTQLARAKEAVSRSVVYTAPPVQAVDLDELRRAACVVNVVGQIDGHDVVRRESVLDVIDTRRQRLIDSQAVGNGN